MVIDVIQTENAAAIAPHGRVDTLTSPDFEQAVKAIPADVAELTIDLADVNYISSAGLRVLLYAEKQMKARGGSMRVVHVSEAIGELFEVTGFDTILTIG